MERSTKDGPGFWWSLLEFLGMTWPGRPVPEAAGPAPQCTACRNPAEYHRGAWRCPTHPQAELIPADE